MKNIICGTDFSTHAAEAANVAAELAIQRQGTLTLLHAIARWEVDLIDKPTIDAIRSERQRKLIEEGARVRASGVHVLEKLALGTPPELLAGCARRLDADLIVVSSLGEVSPLRWIAGSTALRTAQRAPVPTLVVRDHARLTAWIRGERRLNVHVCYDFSSTSDAALRWASLLSNLGPCRMTVTYVAWPPQEAWRLGVTGRSNDGEITPEIQALLERGIREKCAGLPDGISTRIHVSASWGRADIHLNELARANDADLVVVGTNQRNMAERLWNGSISRGVIRHCRTNVVCVPGDFVPRNAPANPDAAKRFPARPEVAEENEQPVAAELASAARELHASPAV